MSLVFSNGGYKAIHIKAVLGGIVLRNSNSRIQLIIKISIIFSFLFSFVSYSYMDFIATQRHGIEVWNTLINGNIRNFYYVCAENTMCAAVYDFSIYFIFAIWNFPVWIYERITGIDAQTLQIFILYGKGIVFAFFFGCIYVFKKIVLFVNNQYEESIFVKKPELQLMVSALFTVYSFYTGHYDVISLFFILLGILFLLKNKKIAFALMFSIAFSFKFFALWLFIPIVLTYEKKIVRIVGYLLGISGVYLFENLFFHKNAALKALGASQFSAVESINFFIDAGKTEMFGSGVTSMCIIAYALLCIWCYFCNFIEKKEDVYRIFYICFLTWMIFFSFVKYNTYWIVFYVPFLVFIATFDKSKEGINIILEMILSVSLYVVHNIRQYWVVGYPINFDGTQISANSAGIIGQMFWSLNGYISDFFIVSEFLNEINSRINLYVIFQSFIVAISISMIVINHPKYVVRFKCTDRTINALYYMRIFINLILLVTPPLLFVIGQL